jgi:hypothetical protein
VRQLRCDVLFEISERSCAQEQRFLTMQTKNVLTVAGFLNVASPFQFGHGLPVVNRVGQVGSRKRLHWGRRVECSETGFGPFFFFSEVISVMASEWKRDWSSLHSALLWAALVPVPFTAQLTSQSTLKVSLDLCWCELLKVEGENAALGMNFNTSEACLKWGYLRLFLTRVTWM